MINVVHTSYSVADYCQDMQRKEIIVNREYQRSDEVWPPAARSFLIETILLGYPIPKLSLYQIVDLRSRTNRREIVDGQQRSKAISDYYEDKYSLAKSLELDDIRGRSFSELSEDYQTRFLAYSLQVDLFVAATSEEIREAFRRINSYTVPLNPEEQRYAKYQGEVKWFIYRLSRRFGTSLKNIGVFSEKQLVRMADSKLFTEVCHATVNGITTTSKKALDQLYAKFDKDFPEVEQLEKRLDNAVARLVSLEELHRGPLTRTYIVYSLLLALMHMQQPISQLANVYQRTEPYRFERDIVATNLSRLAEALEDPEETLEELSNASESENKIKAFVLASSERTNVKSQREIRFRTLCEALEPKLL